ncbi:MAG: phosphotransferase family protein [Pseudomonadales bacterium]|nr:phosphotransferase family protein [Pseudomonadales bacterium]MCP5172044.1 phosphotransferase family protein [Pseudomonadales bacterium]
MPLNEPLQRAISHWPHWGDVFTSKPEIICRLQGGLTNESYLLEADGKKVVLRLNSGNSEQLGINRHHEAVILAVVANAGIAPMVHYCSPEEGVLVTAYIDGQPLDITRPETISRVRCLLEKVHRLRPDIPVFDYIRHVTDYQKITGWQGACQQITPLLEKLQSASGRGLCHHDPVPANFIDADGRLYLLDWEYAGLGAPEFDLAAARAEFSTFCVTSRYADELIFAADRVYQHSCQLWKRLNSSHSS